MKNSTLVFRSLAIIIFIVGIAHLATYASQKKNLSNYDHAYEAYQEETVVDDLGTKVTDNETSDDINENDQETDYIIGTWKVKYNSQDFKGAIIYNLKKEGDVFNAYTLQYQDEKGHAEKAEGSKTLTIKKFDGYKGTGVYAFEYEDELHQVDCRIDMVDENTFKLSYDYYGYKDVETWKRQ